MKEKKKHKNSVYLPFFHAHLESAQTKLELKAEKQKKKILQKKKKAAQLKTTSGWMVYCTSLTFVAPFC